jgi:hypothetical protein
MVAKTPVEKTVCELKSPIAAPNLFANASPPFPYLGVVPLACDHAAPSAALPILKGSVALFQASCNFSFGVIGATFLLLSSTAW